MPDNMDEGRDILEGYGTVTLPADDAPAPEHDFKPGDTVCTTDGATFTVLEDCGRDLLCAAADGTEYHLNPLKLKAG